MWNSQASANIYLYDEPDDSWLLVGKVPTPRYDCQAEVVGGFLVVVGGWLDTYTKCDLVEIASFVF